MGLDKALIYFLCFVTITVSGQNTSIKKQLTGSVLDVNTNKGIEGVQVRLLSTGDIQYTDSEGKFKFFNEKEFVIGEPNYSFLIYKEGYIPAGSTSDKVMFGSGDIGNLGMKLDINRYLWITIQDGKTGEFVNGAKVDINGLIKTTNEFGKVRFDFYGFDIKEVKVSVSKKCYRNDIFELPVNGEKQIKITPTCNNGESPVQQLDLSNSLYILDRAILARDGAVQGQNEALKLLIENGYMFENANFDGISFAGAVLTNTNFSTASFKVSNLNETDFDSTKLNNANFNFSNVTKATFNNVTAKEVYFQYLEAENVSFQNANLYRSSFFLSNLSGADFTNADLKGVCLAYCNLTGANFTGANLTDAFFYGSVLNKAIFKNAIIKNTDVSGAVADEIKFTKEQRDEFCKSAPLGSFVTVEIWGENMGEARYNYRYPDFKSYYTKLSRTYLVFSGNLKIRQPEAIQPIGAFRNVTGQRPSYISQYHYFDSKFWDHANRGHKLMGNLEKNIDFIHANINKQRLIMVSKKD